MDKEQADKIISTILGLSASHTQRLEIAQRTSDLLAEAVQTLKDAQ